MILINNVFSLSLNDKYKSYTSFGLDSALKNIENKVAIYLIIDDEISPRWFGKHLIAMALTTRSTVRIIIMPKLKAMTKEIFKIPTIMLSFKNNPGSLEEFYKKLNVHEEFHKNYRRIRNEPVDVKKKKKKAIVSNEIPIVHLKKQDNHPAFIPQNQSEKMDAETTDDFISLKKYEEPKKSADLSYRPMKIKQVFPNPNRKKK
jgi:hypothetical protein